MNEVKVIHMKHNGIFRNDTVRKSDLDFWRILSKEHTQCWEFIDDSIEATDMIGDITCETCLDAMNERCNTDEGLV